jgi:hypothetical protein
MLTCRLPQEFLLTRSHRRHLRRRHYSRYVYGPGGLAKNANGQVGIGGRACVCIRACIPRVDCRDSFYDIIYGEGHRKTRERRSLGSRSLLPYSNTPCWADAIITASSPKRHQCRPSQNWSSRFCFRKFNGVCLSLVRACVSARYLYRSFSLFA